MRLNTVPAAEACIVRSEFRGFLAALTASPGNQLELIPIVPGEIEEAERRLGASLPSSYSYLVARYGAGYFAGEEVLRPKNLYPFDEDCGRVKGFIGLVGNLSGCGDYLAFNPRDQVTDGERPVYYISHDPPGYALLVQSFEDWMRKVARELAADGPSYGCVDDALEEL